MILTSRKYLSELIWMPQRSAFARQKVPFVTTLHGRLDLPELKPIFNAFRDVPVVSISDAQRLALPQLGVGTSDHQKDRGMIKAAKKPSSVCIVGKVVGCRAAEHREKANGIDEACGEGRPVSNTCGDAH
jgi:hypothetical protein